jgi:Protein of unknown function (DUF3617)
MTAATRLASALAGLAAAALVHAQGADELWQMNTTMEMEGMQLPAMSQQVCMKKGQTSAEGLGQQDRNCKVTDQRRSGNKFTWKMVCTGDEPMTGTGEMTRNRDTLEGRMLMKGKDGEMKIVYSGRLSGTCNAATHRDPQVAAAQAQIATMQAQSNAQIAELCRQSIEKFETGAFEMAQSPCLARKDEYCAHVKKTAQGMRTPAGYRKALQADGLRNGGWEHAAQFCRIDPAPVTAAACQSGMGARDWDFVAQYCPAESQKIAAGQCAGRDYTVAMSSEYKAICGKYASSMTRSSGTAAKPQQPAQPSATDAVKEGVQGLRKLFGN